jgi:hypothetical protein
VTTGATRVEEIFFCCLCLPVNKNRSPGKETSGKRPVIGDEE